MFILEILDDIFIKDNFHYFCVDTRWPETARSDEKRWRHQKPEYAFTLRSSGNMHARQSMVPALKPLWVHMDYWIHMDLHKRFLLRDLTRQYNQIRPHDMSLKSP